MKQPSFSPLSNLLEGINIKKNPYVSKEYQDFGYRLAVELNDLPHKSLYIKLAKQVDRSLLERARSFVIDADSAKSKARLFMWKLKQLREQQKKQSPPQLEQQKLF